MLTSKKSFENIVSGFTKTIDQLDSLLKQNDLQMAKNKEISAKLKESQIKLQEESNKASNLKENLTKFLGV